MPKKAYSPEEVQAVKNRIMDEASRMMAEQGIANISMRALAKALDMTAPNLYNYFPNKHELFVETSKRGFELLSQNIEVATQNVSSSKERLRAILKASLPFVKEYPGYWELLFHPPISLGGIQGTPLEEADRQHREKTFALLMGSVNEVAEEVGGDQDVPIRAITAMTNVHGLIDLYIHRVLDQLGGDVEQSIEFLIDRSLDLIFPELDD